MKKRYGINLAVSLIPFLIFILFPVVSAAEDANDPEYTIKKGDTLWDISSEKFKDPFLWQKIWKANPQIKNPDLIFPGQKLNLPDMSGSTEEEKGAAKEKAETPKEKTPKIISSAKLNPKSIRIGKPTPLATGEIILRSGYISGDIRSSGKITVSLGGAEVMGQGAFVYIVTDKPVPPKTKFYILSTPEKITHPVTSNFVGYLIRIKGVLETKGMENGNIKALILNSYEEIAEADSLADFYQIKLPVDIDSGRRPVVSGYIMKIANEKVTGGTDETVYIDKGSDDGITTGDLFEILTSKKPGIPIGTLQVISVQDKTAVGYVKKAVREIEAGDSFRN